MKRYAAILILSVAAAAVAGERETDTFAEAYNHWAKLANARTSDTGQDGTISAPEVIAWQKVKSEWRKREKEIDRFYRGER